MEATQEVLHSAHSEGPRDAHGGTSDIWADPVPRMVFGWAPVRSDEPKTVGLNRVVVDVELFSPWPAAPKDRITIDSRVFEVEGESEDWNHGPFGFAPGFVINLRRA